MSYNATSIFFVCVGLFSALVKKRIFFFFFKYNTVRCVATKE